MIKDGNVVCFPSCFAINQEMADMKKKVINSERIVL